MKVALIEPTSPDFHIFSLYPLPRLGTVLLGTILKKGGHDVNVIVESMGEIPWDDVAGSDLVGISTTTSTAPRAYEMAKTLRELGILTVLGGPHVTFMPEEGMVNADFVIRGEGERSLPMLVEALEGKGRLGDVPGLSYWRDQQAVHNPIDQDFIDLNELPEPDFTLIGSETFKKKGWTRRVVPIQTSRGCPYNCNFCSVTPMFGRRMRYRDVESIIAELRTYNSRRNTVFFYDDNFVAHPKRAKQLLARMIEEKFSFISSAQIRVEAGKDHELLELMYKAGLRTVFLGLESVSPGSLKEMQKKQTLADMEEGLRGFKGHKIDVHGMFVFGFDHDDEKTFSETVKFAKRNDIDSVQFLILTPFPGTPVYEDLKNDGRIIIRDWSFYDGHHVVFNPMQVEPYCLQKAQIKGHRRFYSTLEVIRRFYRFEFFNALIAAYAKRLTRTWVKENKFYLKVMKFLKPQGKYVLDIDLRRRTSDIKENVMKVIERASETVRRAALPGKPGADSAENADGATPEAP